LSNPVPSEDGNAASASDAIGANTEATEPGDAAPREKRSRDRYGRDRKARGERTERNGTDTTPSGDAQPMLPLETESSSEEDTAPRKSYFTAPVPQASKSPEQETHDVAPTPATLPASVTPEPTSVPVIQVTPPVQPVAPVLMAAALQVQVEPASQEAMPKVHPFALPLDELAQIAQASGLNWVNSDAVKVSAVQAAIAAEPQAVHVPRVRPAVVAIDDRPLVLVETKRDLRNMTLPFENTEVH
jgi:ribonuclease E